MPCEDGRKYLTPSNTPGLAALPPVPSSAEAWLKTFLQAVKDAIEGKNANPVVPAAIQFNPTESDAGITLDWDPEPNSAFYTVYRNTTNNFSTSKIVGGIYATRGSQKMTWFDSAGQDEVGTDRVYWLRGWGPTGIPGPLSVQTVGVDHGIIPGDRPWTEVLTPGEVRLVEQNGADPVIIRSFGTSTDPTLALIHPRGTEDIPLQTLLGDILGRIEFGGSDGSLEAIGAVIEGLAAADIEAGTPFNPSTSKLGGDGVSSSWAATGMFRVTGISITGDYILVGISSVEPDGAAGTLAKVYRYTISGGTWTQAAGTVPTGTTWISNIVTYGGFFYYAIAGSSTPLGRLIKYDPATNTTTTVYNPGLVPSGSWQTISLDSDNGIIYIVSNNGTHLYIHNYTIGTATGAELYHNAGFASAWTSGSPITERCCYHTNGNLYFGVSSVGFPVATHSRVYRFNTSTLAITAIGGHGIAGNLGDKTRFYDLVQYGPYLYVGTSDGEIWEWNEDTDFWTKIGGDGLNGSWSTTNRAMSVLVYNDVVYWGVQNGSNLAELWQFVPSPGGAVAGEWTMVGASFGSYEDFASIAVNTSTGIMYSGMGSTSGADADFWGVGTVTGAAVVSTNLQILLNISGVETVVTKWWNNGDIGFGLLGDGMFWDDSVTRLGINTSTPSRGLHVATTDGIRLGQGTPSVPALGDIYIAATTGILTWHDGTAARRTVHAPAALTTLNLVKGDGGVTGVQTTGISVSSVDAVTGITLLGLEDTDGTHNLSLKWNENSAANHTLNILGLTTSDRSLTFTADATIGGTHSGTSSGTNTGDVTLAGTPDYITISSQVITRALINLTTHVTGDLPFANLVQASAANLLVGRGSAGGAGDFQEITLGTGLTMTGTVLAATGGGGGGGAPSFKTASCTSNDLGITSEQDVTGASVSLDADGDWLITATFYFRVIGGTNYAFGVGYLNVDGTNELPAAILQANASPDSGWATITQTWVVTIASQPKTVKLRAELVDTGTGATLDVYEDATTLTAVFFDAGPIHATNHENGGSDEINVAGLSGELADPQPPKDHASDHYEGGGDEVDILQLGGYNADPQTFLSGAATLVSPGWRLVGTTATTGTTSTGRWTFTSNVTEIIFTGLAGWSEIMIVTRAITKGTTGTLSLTVSINNGSSYLTASGDYTRITAAGVEANFSALAFYGTNATAARSGIISFRGWNLTTPKIWVEDVRNVTDNTVGCIPTANDLDAFRIFGSGGGNLTGGDVYVFGRM